MYAVTQDVGTCRVSISTALTKRLYKLFLPSPAANWKSGPVGRLMVLLDSTREAAMPPGAEMQALLLGSVG